MDLAKLSVRLAGKGSRWFATAILLVTLLPALIVHAATYVYDANGRLTAVTASTGDTAQYVYDPLGNILAIDTVPAGQLAIFTFSPAQGPVGIPVTIKGQGFDPTGATDVVAFNGTAASLVSASATELVATVPSGATTGPISVSGGSAHTSSLTDFVVTADLAGYAGPTISSFSPSVANAGMPIAVTGTNFVSSAGPTQAGVNEFVSNVTPTNSTQLTFNVPTQTGSGPVTVVTPYGLASSAQPLVVVPTSVGATKVITTSTLIVDAAPQMISIGTAGKYAASLFQGNVGQWLSLQFSQLTTMPTSGTVSLSIYDSANVLIYSATIGANAMSAHLPMLTRPGSYLVLVTPAAGTTAQFSMGLESNASIPGTNTVTVSTTVAGQSKRFTLQALSGADYGIGMVNMAVPAGGGVTAKMYRYDGAPMYAGPNAGICGYHGSYECGGTIRDLLPGTYGVIVAPYDSHTQTFSVDLWVSPDLTGTIAYNAPTTIGTTNPGQNATYTFQGSAGDDLSLAADQIVTNGVPTVRISVLDPNELCLITGNPVICPIFPTSLTYKSLAVLPTTGTYGVVVSPGGVQETQAGTGSLRVTLAKTPVSALALDVPGGTTAATGVLGQHIRYTFNITTPGDNIGLGLTNTTALPTGNNGGVTATVYNAAGTQVGTATCPYPGYYFCSTALRGLSVGAYSILLQPLDTRAQTFSVQVWLSHDLTGTMAVGTSTTIATSNPGQNATYAFQGTAGQQLQLAVDQIVRTNANSIRISAFDPSGACVFQSCPLSLSTSTYTSLKTLPLTGTYTVTFQPIDGGSAAGTASARLTLSETTTATLPLDVSGGTTATTSVVGQQLNYTFAITNAGDNLGLGLTDTTAAPAGGGGVTAIVYNPAGTQVGAATCPYPGYYQCSVALRGLAIGTYSLVVKPFDTRAQTFSTQVWLTHDVTGTMTVGTATTIATSNPGQDATYTFQGTGGQQLQLAIDQVVRTNINYINISVLDPSGACVLKNGTGTLCPQAVTTTKNLPLISLAAAGTYSVVIKPVDGGSRAGTASLRITF